MSIYFCGTCKTDFETERRLSNHLSILPSHHRSDEKVSLHLEPIDCFSVNPDKAAIVTNKGAQGRCMRKNEQRFHRSCIRTKSRAKANRAQRHGWKPIGDVRHHGDNQQ